MDWFYFPRLEAQPHLQCPNPLVGHDPLPVQQLVTLGGGGDFQGSKAFACFLHGFQSHCPTTPNPPPP